MPAKISLSKKEVAISERGSETIHTVTLRKSNYEQETRRRFG